ncbi:MAG: 50S ribosomal protein L30 [Candidatus Thermoplasmatota archaeon]|nr:50S ribosomal protein L30 [Candidatus Thermoplasmatota archaeon]
MVYAVIRVRGTVNIKPSIKKTLELLNLTRANHCVLVDENKSAKGMLQIAKDYVTWGEIDLETLSKLLEARGRLIGDKPLTDVYVQSATSFKTMDAMAKAIIDKKFIYKELPEVKPIFRLNPPVKGFEGIKRSFVNKGALGYRGNEINHILERML